MKKWNYFIRTIGFLIGFVLIYFICGLFIVNDNASTRLTFHDFYHQEENIDVAVIGTSRAYCGFEPETFDTISNVNSFNLGTASQTLDASYYLIKEAISTYDIDTVYLEVEFDILRRSIGGQKNTWIISDYMRGFNKYELIFDLCNPDDWPLMLSRVYRYKDDISLSYCLNNFKAKISKDYWSYINSSNYYLNYNHYMYKGLNYGEKVNSGYDYFAYKDTYGEFDIVSPDAYNDEMIQYLISSIKLCEERDVKIVLFTMPETAFYISQAGDYNAFTEFMNDISEEYNVLYYDFNLLKEDDFKDIEFVNLDHLTIEGAKHFSSILAELFVDPNSHSFYEHIEDSMTEGVIGILYNIKKSDENFLIEWNIVAKNPEQYLYKFYAYSENKESVFESEIMKDTCVALEHKPNEMVLEIYNSEKEYIGNALFM